MRVNSINFTSQNANFKNINNSNGVVNKNSNPNYADKTSFNGRNLAYFVFNGEQVGPEIIDKLKGRELFLNVANVFVSRLGCCPERALKEACGFITTTSPLKAFSSFVKDKVFGENLSPEKVVALERFLKFKKVLQKVEKKHEKLLAFQENRRIYLNEERCKKHYEKYERELPFLPKRLILNIDGNNDVVNGQIELYKEMNNITDHASMFDL